MKAPDGGYGKQVYAYMKEGRNVDARKRTVIGEKKHEK